MLPAEAVARVRELEGPDRYLLLTRFALHRLLQLEVRGRTHWPCMNHTAAGSSFVARHWLQAFLSNNMHNNMLPCADSMRLHLNLAAPTK